MGVAGDETVDEVLGVFFVEGVELLSGVLVHDDGSVEPAGVKDAVAAGVCEEDALDGVGAESVHAGGPVAGVAGVGGDIYAEDTTGGDDCTDIDFVIIDFDEDILCNFFHFGNRFLKI